MIVELHAPDGPCHKCGRDTWRLDRVMFVGGGFATVTHYWSCINCSEVCSCVGQPPKPREGSDPA